MSSAPMSCPAVAPNSLAGSRPLRRRGGFTLVELLTVMVILVSLMGITMIVGHYIVQKQYVVQAQGEMQLIQAALEQFKLAYGEYPPGDPNSTPPPEENISKALTGRARWVVNSIGNMTWDANHPMSEPAPDWGKPFVDASKLTFETDANDQPTSTARMLDPWGDIYLYRYKSLSDIQQADPNRRTWKTNGFILLSSGPDQLPSTVNQPDANFPEGMSTSGIMPPDYFDSASSTQLRDNLLNTASPN